MKQSLITVLLLAAVTGYSQIFWTETFNNGCSSGCSASGVNTGNGAWSVVALAGDSDPTFDYPNMWYVSCAENGHTNTICGTGCTSASATNTLASLHIGSMSAGDIGAAFDAGGWCGILWCTATHKRVVSPAISTVGKTGITLAFDYIEYGDGTNDDMYAVQYSTNGGTIWTTLTNPAKTTCCGGPCNGSRQGKWTALSIALPVACENIANLKLAFVWKNNDDGVGTDPSFAMDNMTLSSPVVLPLQLLDFKYSAEANVVNLSWKTANEINSAYFEIQRSDDAISFYTIGRETANHNAAYEFQDFDRKETIVYYRLKMVDTDNSFQFSDIIVVEGNNSSSQENDYYVNEFRQLEIRKRSIPVNIYETAIIYSTDGRILGKYDLKEYISGEVMLFPTNLLNPGIYLCQLKGNSAQKSFKFFLP